MTAQVVCRVCNTTFLGQPDVVGQPLVCPACREKGAAALQAIQRGEDATLTNTLPPEVELESAGPAWLGKLYALSAGIDLNEASEQEVPNSMAATRLHEEWRTAMPEVPSAYQPSGSLPVAALPAMTLGACAGAGLAALVELA